MTPEQHLRRIYRTYSPPWVLWQSLSMFKAALRLPDAIWLIRAPNPDELARKLRVADHHRSATRGVCGYEFLTDVGFTDANQWCVKIRAWLRSRG